MYDYENDYEDPNSGFAKGCLSAFAIYAIIALIAFAVWAVWRASS